MNSTLNFYNSNSDIYINNTIKYDNSFAVNRFINQLDLNSNILEVGFGSGRDTLSLYKAGYKNITAIDFSQAFVDNLKEQKLNIEVECADILNYELTKKFDAIFCHASLLHLSKNDFKLVLNKLTSGLSENGKLFFNLKLGNGESLDNQQRFFSYWQPQEIINLIPKKYLNSSILYLSKDLERQNTEWLNVTIYNHKKLINIIDKDIISIGEWMGKPTHELYLNHQKMDINVFHQSILEMESTYDEFPNDAKRTKKIISEIKHSNITLPIFIEDDDPHNFVMEGRHRMVAFKNLGFNSINVVKVSPKKSL